MIMPASCLPMLNSIVFICVSIFMVESELQWIKEGRTGDCNGPDHSSRYLNHGKFSNHVWSSGNDICMMHFRCTATVTCVVSCITIFSTSMMYVWSLNLYPGLLEMSVGAAEQGVGTNMDRHNLVNTHDHCYPYPNRTISVIMCLIQMTMDYLNFLRMKKMALAAIFLWPLHQYHILTRHVNIF